MPILLPSPKPYNYKIVRSSGFTLIEMLVVLVIMSLLAAVALFAFSDFDDKAASRQSIQKSIDNARKTAGETGRPTVISLPANTRFQGRSEDGLFKAYPDGSVAPGQLILDNTQSYTVRWADGAIGS